MNSADIAMIAATIAIANAALAIVLAVWAAHAASHAASLAERAIESCSAWEDSLLSASRSSSHCRAKKARRTA